MCIHPDFFIHTYNRFLEFTSPVGLSRDDVFDDVIEWAGSLRNPAAERVSSRGKSVSGVLRLWRISNNFMRSVKVQNF